jgi:pimeloyl-ACP methyl ester carboxylesterase
MSAAAARGAARCARNKAVFLAALSLVLPGAAATARAAPAVAEVWEEVSAEAAIPGPSSAGSRVLETRWLSVRSPGTSADRIQLRRYRSSGESRAALLYLPGTNMNAELSETDPRYNLWLYLAERGIEVWALDYRTHFVSDEDPPTPDAHRFMLDWTLDVFTEDVRAASAFVRTHSGHERPFVAGFSRGVTFAWALACTDPGPLAGLVALDGMFKKQQRAEAFDFAGARAELVAERRYASDVAGRMGWQTRHAMMSAAAREPNGPAQREGFGSVGEQVGHVLYSAWGAGALANPRDGFSRPQVLARLLDSYDRWWPSIQNIEGRSVSEQIDDPRTPIDDKWGKLELPVLYFGATGLGSGWVLDGIYSSVRSGSEDVSLHLLEGYGHLDVLVGERAEASVFSPIADWISDRSTP